MRSILPFAFAVLGLSSNPATALPPSEVSKNLETVIVFAPVDTKSSDSPKPLRFKVDGKFRTVYFAAFSPAAVRQIIDEKLVPQKVAEAKKLKFAPFSLSKFDSLVQPFLDKSDGNRVFYVPDPAQVSIAKKLLIDQGTEADVAKKISVSTPVIFCPNPAFSATVNSGPLKDQTFVPCSTDHATLVKFIENGKSKNKSLAKRDVKVVAIPIPNYTAALAKMSASETPIRILPNPANINAINILKKSL